ncbi:MAG: hypothetical protein JOZ41_02560, partial [Chloroflexi bacterium]|nr:hypothetical protein [Chloroflexota bacterium]
SPSLVYAEVRVRRPGALVDDDTFVALQFPGGVIAHLWMNNVVRILGPRLAVSGLRGSFVKYDLDPQEGALRRGIRPGDPSWGSEPPDRWGRLSTEVNGLHFDAPIENLPGAYERYYALVRDALLAGTPLPVDPADAATVLHVIEAAQRSARTGTAVPFDPSSVDNIVSGGRR